MSYGLYSGAFVRLETEHAMHIFTDAEKSFFHDKGFEMCDFKWGGMSLVKYIGTPSVSYITLRLKDNPYRFVGNISRISESVPTVHGTLNLSTDIDKVEADTLFDCYEKLMVNLRKILEIEKENYIKYIDALISSCSKET